jgi:hypothetical protein
MKIHAFAGKVAPKSMLADIPGSSQLTTPIDRTFLSRPSKSLSEPRATARTTGFVFEKQFQPGPHSIYQPGAL